MLSEKEQSDLISLAAAAKLTGYHQDYLGALCRSGKLPGKKMGRNWVVSESAVIAFSQAADEQARRPLFRNAPASSAPVVPIPVAAAVPRPVPARVEPLPAGVSGGAFSVWRVVAAVAGIVALVACVSFGVYAWSPTPAGTDAGVAAAVKTFDRTDKTNGTNGTEYYNDSDDNHDQQGSEIQKNVDDNDYDQRGIVLGESISSNSSTSSRSSSPYNSTTLQPITAPLNFSSHGISEYELNTLIAQQLTNLASIGLLGIPSQPSSTYNSSTLQPTTPSVAPVITYIQPAPSQNFSGASLLSATDLSSKNFTTTTANITDTASIKTLSVSSTASIAGDLTVTGTITGNVSGTINPNLTTGSLLFQGPSGIAENNANLFWDNTNKRLGVGTSSPSTMLSIKSAAGVNPGVSLDTTDTTTNPFISFNEAGTNTWVLYPEPSPSHKLQIYNNATGYNLMTFAPDSKVGVNAVSPASNLSVAGNASIGSSYQAIAAPIGGLIVEGNAGVGTTNPTAKLQVNGETMLLNGSYPAFTVKGNNGSGSYGLIEFLNSSNSNGMYLIHHNIVGNEGLAVWANTNACAWCMSTMFYSNGNVKIGNAWGAGGISYIQSSGNIGVGTSAPASLLTVNGGATIGSGYTATTAPANGLLVQGNVGIGTTSPVAVLDVNGNINIPGNGGSLRAGNNRILYSDTVYTYVGNLDASRELRLVSGMGANAVLTTGGNLGVGTTAPNAKLDVNGKIYITTAGTDGLTNIAGVDSSANEWWSIKNANIGTGYGRGITFSTRDVRDPILLQPSSNGKVGIGMATLPAYLLDVNGTVNAPTYKVSARAQLGTTAIGGGYGVSPTLSTDDSRDFVLLQPTGGNVGIGTNFPGSVLDVRAAIGLLKVTSTTGTNSAYLHLTNTGGDMYVGRELSTGGNLVGGGLPYAGVVTVNTAHALQFGTNNTARMTIDSAGNVGIGTTSPAKRFTIIDTATDSTLLSSVRVTQAGNAEGAGTAIELGQASNPVRLGGMYTGAGGGGGAFTLSNSVDGGSNYTERLRILPNGNFGIGTTTPSQKLDVSGNILSSGRITAASEFQGTALNSYNTSTLNIGTNGANNLTIINGGNVGIGTTSPAQLLHVYGANKGLLVSNSNDATNYKFSLTSQWDPTESILLDGSVSTLWSGRYDGQRMYLVPDGGRVGIGTTNPTGTESNSYLTVQGADSNAVYSSTINTGLGGVGYVLNRTGGIASRWLVYSPANVTDFRISNGSSDLVTILNSGNVGIGTSSPETLLHLQGAKYTNVDASGQIIIGDTTAYNASPKSGIVFRNKYTSGGLYADMGGVLVGKENATDGNVASYFGLSTRPAGGNITERLRVASTGNVGIGTTSPSAKLEVSGDIKATLASGTTFYTSGYNVLYDGATLTGPGNGAGLYLNSSNATDSASLTFSNANASSRMFLDNTSTLNVQVAGYDVLYLRKGDNRPGNVIVGGLASDKTYNDASLLARGRWDGAPAAIFAKRTSATTANIFSVMDENLSSTYLTTTAAGNVGIGTSSPTGAGSTALHVAGTGGGVNQYGSLTLSNASNSGTNITGSVDFYGSSNNVSAIRSIMTGGGNTGDLYFLTASAGSLVEKLRLSSTGVLRVGYLSDSDNANTSTTRLVVSNQVFGATTRLANFVNGATGDNSNTEIGFGSINASGTGIDVAAIRAIKSSSTVGAEVGQIALYTRNAGTLQESVRINGAGNVGIGTTTPSQLLHVYRSTGGVVARFTDADGSCDIDPTSTALVCSSDATLKKDITTLSGVLPKLQGMRGVSFKWKTQEDEVLRIGVIAQEVEAVFPELVRTDTVTGKKSVNYTGLSPILLQAVKEQQDEITTLQNQIASLQGMHSLSGNTPITFHSHLYLSADSVGQAKILAGSTSVRVTFDRPYQYQPVVTISSLNKFVPAYVKDVDTTGFTIELDTTYNLQLTTDSLFSWHAFASPEAKLTVSDGTTQQLVLVLPPQPAPEDGPLEEGRPLPGEVAGESVGQNENNNEDENGVTQSQGSQGANENSSDGINDGQALESAP